MPIKVAGYEVLQAGYLAPHPTDTGFITHMETDIVDGDGTSVPISRLMLHHIVFVNVSRFDRTCSNFLSWDNTTSMSAPERFYAAGEERAKLSLPDGYGYRTTNTPWAMLYMVMNHRPAVDQAFIQYKVTIETNPAGMTEVHPYWLDVRNCNADPQYTVSGTGGPGSSSQLISDVTIPESGRIVAGAGHVHGGAQKLTLSQPDCGNRQVAESIPTWGLPDHPFYNVRPILHEPGPINMSAFQTPTGIPVSAGERLRLNSIYDNSLPHMRVMGIMLAYLAPDPSVTAGCGALPGDLTTLATNQPGRAGPVRFDVPLTGLDPAGQAISIDAPPGKLRKIRKKKPKPLEVKDRYFSSPNVQIRKGRTLSWNFGSSQLHNLTLANGPEGFASPNLYGNGDFAIRFQRAGTYRFFCSLHPVQMQERVVVKKGKKAKKRKRRKRRS